MNYEFVRFHLAVCKGLGVDPSVTNQELFSAITEQYQDNVDCGRMIGEFDDVVSGAIEKIANDERWDTRITDIGDVQDGDLITITIPVEMSDGFVYLLDAADSIYGPGDDVPSWMTFHHATRKGFHATR